MKCKNCGIEIEQSDRFCRLCGHKVENDNYVNYLEGVKQEEAVVSEEVAVPKEVEDTEEVVASEEVATSKEEVTPEEVVFSEEVTSSEEVASSEDVVFSEEVVVQEEAAPEEVTSSEEVVTPEAVVEPPDMIESEKTAEPVSYASTIDPVLPVSQPELHKIEEPGEQKKNDKAGWIFLSVLLVIVLVLVCLLAWMIQKKPDERTVVRSPGNSAVEDRESTFSEDLFRAAESKEEVIQSHSTLWFDFSVLSIVETEEYGNNTSEEGYKFVIVTVKETNTFGATIPMSCYDFTLEADGLLEEETWPYDPFYYKMMSDDFELRRGESIEGDVVFIIPEDIQEIDFVYVEVADDDTEYDTYKVHYSF